MISWSRLLVQCSLVVNRSSSSSSISGRVSSMQTLLGTACSGLLRGQVLERALKELGDE